LPTVFGAFDFHDVDGGYDGAPAFIKDEFEPFAAGIDAISSAAINVAAGAKIGQFKLRAASGAHQSYTATGQVGTSMMTASVHAQWEDTIRLQAANTTKATLHGRFVLHGSLGAGALAQPLNLVPTLNWAAAQIGFILSMTAGLEPPLPPHPISTASGVWDALVRDTTHPTQVEYQYALPQEIPYNIVVTPGVTYPLQAFAQLKVNAGAQSVTYIQPGQLSALFAGELTNTISWGGIDSVTDAVTGEPIENWSITSESGFDYSRPFPVPEPSSLALFGFGLCAWLGLARTRRS
jgi:hypothetical protein